MCACVFIGCKECVDGFVGLYMKHDKFICTESLYLSDTTLDSTSAFIPNCKHYTVDPLGIWRCYHCDSNFIPTIEGYCVSNSNVQNCELAQSDEHCHMCSENHVLVDTCSRTNTTSTEFVFSFSSFEKKHDTLG